MIQCNVATGHYPIIEIVLRALISDPEIQRHTSRPLIGQLAPSWASDWPGHMMGECQSRPLITLYHDSCWHYTDCNWQSLQLLLSDSLCFTILNPPDICLRRSFVSGNILKLPPDTWYPRVWGELLSFDYINITESLFNLKTVQWERYLCHNSSEYLQQNMFISLAFSGKCICLMM